MTTTQTRPANPTKIQVILDPETRKRLKVKAAEQDTTISEIVREAIEQFLNAD